MIRMLKLSLLTLCLSLGLCSCISVRQPAPELRTFALEAPRSGAPARQNFSGGVVVMPTKISPIDAGRELIYVKEDRRRVADYNNTYIDEPEKLVREELRKWLVDSAIFDQVMTESAVRRGKYYIQSRVNYLESDFRNQTKPVAYVEMDFWLLEYPSSKEVKRHLHKVIKAQVPIAKDKNVKWDCVGALSKCLQEVFRQFEAELLKL